MPSAAATPQITRMAWPGGRLVGDRMSHARQLVAAAERLYPGRIAFHWRTPFEGLDLAAKTATVQPEGGEARAVPYDLLIAADGVWSKVRTAAEAQCQELSSSIEPGESSYKVFRSVALPPELALGDGHGGHAIRFLRGARGGIFLSPSCGSGASPDPLVGSGALSMPTQDWVGLEDEEAVAQLLRREYPVFG